jgi:transcriptional regulator with XRE-family HTH domain
MQINEKIKQARLLRGWSQHEIAGKLEESRSSYAEWERETVPRVDILVKIANITGVPIAEFIKAIDPNAIIASGFDEKPSMVKMSLDFLSGKLEAKKETIEQIEARRQEAREWAERAERDKEKLSDMLDKALTTINGVLTKLLTNSEDTKENMTIATIEMQSEHRAIMDTLDIIAKQPVGTTVGKADILEDAARAPMKKSRTADSKQGISKEK